MTHPEWYKHWFNSPYYELLYSNRDEQEAALFLEKLMAVLQPLPGARMLDMPCGRGRHSRLLAAKGYDVVGVDLSEQAIKEAKHFETDNLTFAVHDMRELFYINYFNFAFNLFTSLGYFKADRENVEVIRTFSSALRKGGKLVVDFMNVRKIISEIQPHWENDIQGVHFNIQKEVKEHEIIKQIEVVDKGAKFYFEEQVQALTLADFERHFSANHLKIVHTFGDYSLNPFSETTSDRLILIAEKI